jgi:hypothetical protein
LKASLLPPADPSSTFGPRCATSRRRPRRRPSCLPSSNDHLLSLRPVARSSLLLTYRLSDLTAAGGVRRPLRPPAPADAAARLQPSTTRCLTVAQTRHSLAGDVDGAPSPIQNQRQASLELMMCSEVRLGPPSTLLRRCSVDHGRVATAGRTRGLGRWDQAVGHRSDRRFVPSPVPSRRNPAGR